MTKYLKGPVLTNRDRSEPVLNNECVMKGTGRLRFCTRPVPFMTRFLYGTGLLVQQVLAALVYPLLHLLAEVLTANKTETKHHQGTGSFKMKSSR